MDAKQEMEIGNNFVQTKKEQTNLSIGWLCPKCNIGVAPWMESCPNCKQYTITVTPKDSSSIKDWIGPFTKITYTETLP